MSDKDCPWTVTMGNVSTEIYDIDQLEVEIENNMVGNRCPNEIVLHEDRLFDLAVRQMRREFAGQDDKGPFVWFRSIKLRPPRAREDRYEIWIWEKAEH